MLDAVSEVFIVSIIRVVTSRWNIPEGSHFHVCRRENLESHKLYTYQHMAGESDLSYIIKLYKTIEIAVKLMAWEINRKSKRCRGENTKSPAGVQVEPCEVLTKVRCTCHSRSFLLGTVVFGSLGKSPDHSEKHDFQNGMWELGCHWDELVLKDALCT
jgi:hypothetical protein